MSLMLTASVLVAWLHICTLLFCPWFVILSNATVNVELVDCAGEYRLIYYSVTTSLAVCHFFGHLV